METRRLELLAELSRLGSMRAVADVLGTTTSTVSQQIAVLAREMGTPLIEPAGRRVRLTPAGRRLAEHAVTILAAVQAAQLDLGPEAEPNGTLRVAGFTTAFRAYLLPAITELTATHPRVRVLVREHEPAEARQLLAADQADLALVYDYNLAPAAADPAMHRTPLWTTRWGLGVPASRTRLRRDDAADLRPLPGSRLDRQLPQHRGRGRHPHARSHGRVHAPHHPPGRQPGPGPGHDHGRAGRRAAPTRPRCPRRSAPPSAHRSRRRVAGVRRHPPRAPELAPARPSHQPAAARQPAKYALIGGHAGAGRSRLRSSTTGTNSSR